MEITQSYARPSSAAPHGDGLGFSLSTQNERPPVALQALVRDSLAYARAMLALHEVVSGDLRFHEKDHTAYQEWVQGKYLEELDAVAGDRLRALPGQREELEGLRESIAPLQKRERELYRDYEGGDIWKAKSAYWKYLYTHNKALWWLLDPVVSVHPDGVIFEVFSQDESSYGRVTVPMEKLETLGDTQFGTTNVDFSQRLADELMRVRNYRPAFLEIGAGGVAVSTTTGTQFEKKIDLPPSWVRGFLQVQSASSLPGETVILSASTVSEMLLALRQRREKGGPRSLRFKLTPGQKPSIEIEPWGVEIAEPTQVWNGGEAQEIRIWGRRRLFVLESLLAHAQTVQVKLLGSGMPSYWIVEQGENGHRFELGLSGWTENDWSGAARFDLLASTQEVTEGDVNLAADFLQKALKATPAELAARTDLSQSSATAALQEICREGRAMYDATQGAYRWRQLLPFAAPKTEEDNRLAAAKRYVMRGGVKCKEITESDDLSEFLERQLTGGTRLFQANVKTTGGTFEPTIGLDADGRARFAQCTCGEFRRDKLRKGPCAHILAACVIAGQMQSATTQKADRFEGQTWVFTGALSLFTREQAEKLITDGGGKASGSVSKNTTYLVVGERAGSKLEKAKGFGVPVMTEAQFGQVLAGKDVAAVIEQAAEVKA